MAAAAPPPDMMIRSAEKGEKEKEETEKERERGGQAGSHSTETLSTKTEQSPKYRGHRRGGRRRRTDDGMEGMTKSAGEQKSGHKPRAERSRLCMFKKNFAFTIQQQLV